MAKKARKEVHDQENILEGSRRTIVLCTLGIIACISNFDANGISTILPTVAKDLNAQKTILWAGISSLIANTIFTVQYGRISDIFGRTTCLVLTLCIFGLAELICGFSQSGPMLYVARGLTGMSGGALQSLIIIIASDIVPLEKRGKYQGLVGGFSSLGTIGGPFIASGFAMGATWRAFFWFLVPMGIGAAFLGYYLLPSNRPTDKFTDNVRKIDWMGSLASATCIVSLLIPISGGGSYYSWDDGWVIGLLVLSLASLVAFIFVEWKYAALPMIPLAMFRDVSVCALMAQTFFVAWVSQMIVYFVPIYAQNLRGWSPMASAGLLTANAAFLGVTSIGSGYYISKKKRYGSVIRVGNILLLIGIGLMIIFEERTSLGVIIPVLMIAGTGLGFTTQPTVVALQAHTKKKYRAVVSSCRNFMRSLGAATGVAASSGIFQASLQNRLPEWAREEVGENTYSIPEDYRDELSPYYAKAYRDVMIAGTVLMALNVLLGLLWKDEGLSRKEDATKRESDVSIDSLSSSAYSKSDEFVIDLQYPAAAWGVDVMERMKRIA